MGLGDPALSLTRNSRSVGIAASKAIASRIAHISPRVDKTAGREVRGRKVVGKVEERIKAEKAGWEKEMERISLESGGNWNGNFGGKGGN